MAASLGGSYIPNRFCHPLSKSSQRMFCGRFSTSGGVLLTACQEAVIKLYDSESVYQWSTKNVGKNHIIKKKNALFKNKLCLPMKSILCTVPLVIKYSSSSVS